MPESTDNQGARPTVAVSRCLGLAPCRWDGAMIASPAVAELAPHVALYPVCPEVEMGLGVPRDAIRIVDAGAGRRLVQPATGRDLTDAIAAVVARHVEGLADADGIVLKGRSPSCGLRDARVYPSPEHEEPDEATAHGMFVAGLLERLPHLAAIDDEGLIEPGARHHWLTRVFARARFRAARAVGSRDALVRYQSDNKLLLMAHDKPRLQQLGHLIGTAGARPLSDTWAAYEEVLHLALAQPARPGGHANTLMHALGYLKRELAPEEKRQFLDLIARYREGQAPLSACLALMSRWIARTGEPYLARQTYFEPYPAALLREI